MKGGLGIMGEGLSGMVGVLANDDTEERSGLSDRGCVLVGTPSGWVDMLNVAWPDAFSERIVMK